jgi:malate dehydrogenase (oxaloacetate-decarboxylating)(NADP+)
MPGPHRTTAVSHRLASRGRGISLDGLEVVDPADEGSDQGPIRHGARGVAPRPWACRSTTPSVRCRDPNMYACLMVREGAADAVLGGLNTFYPETIRPALQVLKVEEGRSIVSSLYIVVVGVAAYFLTDCAVNIQPTAEQLAEIALAAAKTAERSSTGSPGWPSSATPTSARRKVRSRPG